MYSSSKPFSTAMASEANSNQLQGEQYISTFYCRALYDYQAKDASSLSFYKDDIIEVLSQLDSGWWDGLVRDERGWFPSNYVSRMSWEEVESALSDLSHKPTSDESIDMSHALTSQLEELAIASLAGSAQSSDFWVPQVTSDAQNYYYVNTQTGQQSREIPQDPDDEHPKGDMAGLASPSTARPGLSNGLNVVLPTRSDSRDEIAGFGVPKHSGTPEPWVRRLADDGRSYYYHNKIDGQIVSTLPASASGRTNGQYRPHGNISGSSNDPESTAQQPFSRSDSLSMQSGSRYPLDRRSVYSEDSDIDPSDRALSASLSTSQSSLLDPLDRTPSITQRYVSQEKGPLIHLTPAERLAQSLQQAMAPPPPELVTELSDTARRAISAVVTRVQSVGLPRGEGDNGLEEMVGAVVVAVRDLLYISAPPPGHIPSNLIPQHARDVGANTASQAMLKPAQRKVTATLSKLVLSARAIQFDSGPPKPDAPLRIEGDAEELERAVVAFVLEVQRSLNQSLVEQLGRNGLKRLRGVFMTTNIGLGLVGAGAAGNWKGFGWIPLDERDEGPGRILGSEVISGLKVHMAQFDGQLDKLGQVLNSTDKNPVRLVFAEGQNFLTHLSAFLNYVADIHVARHVDVDGISQESGTCNEHYAESVENARLLVRTLEVSVQALHDDSASLLITIQSVRPVELGQSDPDTKVAYDRLNALSTALRENIHAVDQTLEALLLIGLQQADMSQGDYNGSIEWRMSRTSMIESRLRPASAVVDETYDAERSEYLDLGAALAGPSGPVRSHQHALHHTTWQSGVTITDDSHPRESVSSAAPTWGTRDSVTPTIVPDEPPEPGPGEKLGDSAAQEDEQEQNPKRHGDATKASKVLGEALPHYVNTATADTKPWYLRPNYDPNEILIDPDGGVKAGTVPSLVERLTAHEHADPNFNKTFLMTFKSFTTVNELFDFLLARFNIQPPPNLTPDEHRDWVKLKQHVVQTRVFNIFKAMIADEDVLEKEDMHIFDRMKEFISQEDVGNLAAAKQLLILIERSREGGPRVLVNTSLERPPAPIPPKNSKKPKLLDIDPLELARQLTIVESNLYQKIRPMECLVRSRKQSGEHNDNIATIIQLCNRIALWVTDSILEKEDSRKRAAVLKHFISVADRCRFMNNYSSMVAIISGLNNPPIRRLKRTWEQIGAKFRSLLSACEMTIDTGKNFANYRTTLAKVTPPCVPFIGVFLTTLTFIQDGAEDNISGNLVNFRKRQKASEVIRDIKRWQSPPYNLQPLPSVQSYLDESLKQFKESVELGDYFWNLSLEREPREREDEKMARLLQESGFL